MPSPAQPYIRHIPWLTTSAASPGHSIIPNSSRGFDHVYRGQRIATAPTMSLDPPRCVRYADRLRRVILRSLRFLEMPGAKTDSTHGTGRIARTIVDAG
jgi:hypothetical protein